MFIFKCLFLFLVFVGHNKDVLVASNGATPIKSIFSRPKFPTVVVKRGKNSTNRSRRRENFTQNFAPRTRNQARRKFATEHAFSISVILLYSVFAEYINFSWWTLVEWAAELPLLKTCAKLGSNVQAKFKRHDGSEKVASKNEFAFFLILRCDYSISLY